MSPPPSDAGAGGGARGVLNLHASTVVVGERGVLIRGAPGAGKTSLALALVERARSTGTFARLVADDRTLVTRHGEPHGGLHGDFHDDARRGSRGSARRDGRLVARPHPALAGLVERRGLGVRAVEHEPACVVGLVVDLADGPVDRLPEPGALRCTVAGVALPRIGIPCGSSSSDAAALVSAALSDMAP